MMKNSTHRSLHGALLLCLILMSTAIHATDSTVWKVTQTISAPEAVQAAAADEKFLYAIANDRVARYDRQSGERLAVSEGPAKHLNSGFFHDDKLYCAHSNYPRLPEQSEIKILDPENMRLTTHHDFGNFGGSLTWVIRHEGHWWCNFARYGEVNHETFLVKLDDEWQEQARWTYPPELIAKLGRFSLSGGIWHASELLVTDHDHGRLYRLTLPDAGNVLTFHGTIDVPVTGQGIAVDPKTGGLVGINRAKKQILLLERREAKACDSN